MPGPARPPLLSAYARLAESRFARAMNWLIAAAGVTYAAWTVAGQWPAPGLASALACAGAAAGVALACVDPADIARRAFARLVFRRMVRRPSR